MAIDAQSSVALKTEIKSFYIYCKGIKIIVIAHETGVEVDDQQ